MFGSLLVLIVVLSTYTSFVLSFSTLITFDVDGTLVSSSPGWEQGVSWCRDVMRMILCANSCSMLRNCSWMVHVKGCGYSLLYKVSYNFHSPYVVVCTVHILGTRTCICTCSREGHIHKCQSKNNTRLVRKTWISWINGWVNIATIGT